MSEFMSDKASIYMSRYMPRWGSYEVKSFFDVFLLKVGIYFLILLLIMAIILCLELLLFRVVQGTEWHFLGHYSHPPVLLFPHSENSWDPGLAKVGMWTIWKIFRSARFRPENQHPAVNRFVNQTVLANELRHKLIYVDFTPEKWPNFFRTDAY